MLTDPQKDKITALLNANIDIPFVPEYLEEMVLREALDVIDVKLDEVVPKAVQRFLGDAGKGLDRNQAKAFAERLTIALNKRVDVPLVDEELEAKVIRQVVDVVVKGLTENRTLDGLLASAG